jgi:hypothetical protein
MRKGAILCRLCVEGVAARKSTGRREAECGHGFIERHYENFT